MLEEASGGVEGGEMNYFNMEDIGNEGTYSLPVPSYLSLQMTPDLLRSVGVQFVADQPIRARVKPFDDLRFIWEKSLLKAVQ